MPRDLGQDLLDLGLVRDSEGGDPLGAIRCQRRQHPRLEHPDKLHVLEDAHPQSASPASKQRNGQPGPDVREPAGAPPLLRNEFHGPVEGGQGGIAVPAAVVGASVSERAGPAARGRLRARVDRGAPEGTHPVGPSSSWHETPCTSPAAWRSCAAPGIGDERTPAGLISSRASGAPDSSLSLVLRQTDEWFGGSSTCAERCDDRDSFVAVVIRVWRLDTEPLLCLRSVLARPSAGRCPQPISSYGRWVTPVESASRLWLASERRRYDARLLRVVW